MDYNISKVVNLTTLTETTKTSIVNKLKKYNVASVTPVIVTPETTSIILTTNVKYSQNATTKTGDSIRSNVITTLSTHSITNLQKFEGLFRYSQLIQDIDDTDTSILSILEMHYTILIQDIIQLLVVF